MIEQQYIDLFTQFREELDAHSVKGLNIHRDAAFEVFRQIGFPTSKQEDYRQSDIVRAFDAELGLNLRNIPVPVNPYNAFKCDVPNLSTHLYFLINDRYYERFQPAGNLPQGVFAGSMQLFSEKYPEVFAAHYNRIADYTDNGVVAYNTMFAQDGFCDLCPQKCDT